MAAIAKKSATATPRPPRLVRGSLVTLRRKCGKASCRCADGDQLHENPALSFSEHGRTRIVALRPEDVAAVTAALGRYRTARDKLDQDAAAGIEALRVWVAVRRQRDAGR